MAAAIEEIREIVEPAESFRAAIASSGMLPPAEMLPGKFCRFPDSESSRNKNGWCIYYLNPDGSAGGCFGNWKDIYQTWFSGNGNTSPAQKKELQKQIEKAKAKAEAERKQEQENAAKRAQNIFKNATPANYKHPYLKRKQVKSYGLKQTGKALVMPIYNKDRQITSLQFVCPDGFKKFLPGGRIAGCFSLIGTLQSAPDAFVCEGYATAATIHETTGKPVLVALNAGNLLPSCKAIKKMYPDIRLTIVADNDAFTSGNPGKIRAETAAKAINAKIVLPHFQDTSTKPTDINDLYLLEGKEEVLKQIENAYAPIAKPASKTYRLTELGNAERFADQHGEMCRFVTAWNKWLLYDGKRWQVGADERVRRLAQDTAKSLYLDAAKAQDQDVAAKLAKWAGTSCKSSSITAMLKEASALLAIEPEKLDSDPWLFNSNNCTINLKTGFVQKHNKDDFITKIILIDFLQEATAPIFKNVLNACLDADVVEFVQQYFGYCITGSQKEQCLSIWHGTGQNGKSTILNIVSTAFGDYAQTTRPETLMVKYNNQNTSDLAKLKGARLVIAAEGEDGNRLAESAIKQMTGGEKIQARALYADWFEYVPEFKIVLCTNHKPVIRGTDYAIWRRIRLIPFSVTIPESEQDKDLPEKLQNELPGILKWIVEGAAKWLSYGLQTPEKVKMATQNYQTEQNVIRNFLDCQCLERPDVSANATDLFQEFEKWRVEEGHRKITQTKFGRMLSELGFEKSRNSVGRMIYPGIGLNSEANYSDYSNKTANYSEGLFQ